MPSLRAARTRPATRVDIRSDGRQFRIGVRQRRVRRTSAHGRDATARRGSAGTHLAGQAISRSTQGSGDIRVSFASRTRIQMRVAPSRGKKGRRRDACSHRCRLANQRRRRLRDASPTRRDRGRTAAYRRELRHAGLAPAAGAAARIGEPVAPAEIVLVVDVKCQSDDAGAGRQSTQPVVGRRTGAATFARYSSTRCGRDCRVGGTLACTPDAAIDSSNSRIRNACDRTGWRVPQQTRSERSLFQRRAYATVPQKKGARRRPKSEDCSRQEISGDSDRGPNNPPRTDSGHHGRTNERTHSVGRDGCGCSGH